MEENYSIDEILSAVNELQNFKRKKKINLVVTNKKNTIINVEVNDNKN